jgi:hypothetical protein
MTTPSSRPAADATPIRLTVELEIPPTVAAEFRRIFGEPSAESFARFLDHTLLLGTQARPPR